MEVVRSRPFLTGAMMFSSISDEYEKNIKNEIFGCFRYMKMKFDDIYAMPTKDRRFFIQKHNDATNQDNEEYEKMTNKST